MNNFVEIDVNLNYGDQCEQKLNVLYNFVDLFNIFINDIYGLFGY